MLTFTISSHTEGGKQNWYATSANNNKFLVGHTAHYETYVGITNDGTPGNVTYKPADWFGRFGQWCYVIHPTAIAESAAKFTSVNTYDKARFTFGFGQFAAHVAGGDFVLFFRDLLQNDPAKNDYYPDLEVRSNQIHQQVDGQWVNLESNSNARLMAYFNPHTDRVEDIEVLHAARFIHWCDNHPLQREIQVKHMAQTAKGLVRRVHQAISLEGRVDKVCLVAMDILHQGRGKKQAIVDAIAHHSDSDAYNNLLQIGAQRFPERIQTLKQTVIHLEASGNLGRTYYHDATQTLS